MAKELILVTGANGYIASRLIPRLLAKGYRVRALARQPERLTGRIWLPEVEVMQGDVHGPEGLEPALAGVQAAYYLVHSMARGRGYARIEIEAAERFASAAERAGISHIIYLGGLADPHAKNLAPHMRSRIETGETLRKGHVPVTEFRAGVIVGPGSISFEMIRFLTECFPILPGPAWLRNKVQPIAATNVIDYLVAALDRPEARGGIYEMGGPDIMHYADTMLRYAEARGLQRWLFTLPGIPIGWMARFVDWLTPVPFSIAAPLVGGLQSDSIVLDDAARQRFHEIHLRSYRQAVDDSLAELAPARVERVWEGFGLEAVTLKHEGFFVDHRRVQVAAPPDVVYGVFSSLGGADGWLYANWLWRLRGWIDKLLGGYRTSPPLPRETPGVRRLREAPPERSEGGQTSRMDEPGLREGDYIDYYCVEAVEPGRMMRLRSTLRAPGEGWMEWCIDDGLLQQTAFFAPRGLPGFLYWYLLSPFHRFVFRGLLKALKQKSERL